MTSKQFRADKVKIFDKYDLGHHSIGLTGTGCEKLEQLCAKYYKEKVCAEIVKRYDAWNRSENFTESFNLIEVIEKIMGGNK